MSALDGVVTLSTVAPERVEWLWPARLPIGKLVVLDGDPSLGKSTLMLDLAARLSTGAALPDGSPVDACDVVVLSAEDGLADTIRPRLDAAGGDASRVHAFVHVDCIDETGKPYTRPPSLPADVDRLEEIVTATGAKLVIVDVLAAYLGAAVDSYRDQDVRRALHRLAALAERTGCVVLVIRHLAKSGGPNPLYRGGGSIGIIGAARAGLLVAADPDDETGARRILAVTKCNLAPIAPALAYRLVPDDLRGCARVEWDGATAHTAAQLLAGTDEDRGERDEAKDFLVQVLSAGPLSSKQVKDAARRAGISEPTLKRAKSDLGVRARKLGMNAGWVWHLAEGDHEPPKESEGAHSQNVIAFDPLRGGVSPFGAGEDPAS